MGRNTPYPLDYILKIKKTNPNWEFKGKDKEIYDEFIKSQENNSELIETIENIEEPKKEEPKKKSKVKKVKQVVESKNTESLDYFVENEVDEDSEQAV